MPDLPPAVRRPIPAVLAVVIRDNRVLLVRRANPPDVGLWGFPGGKIDLGETIEAAAVRELFEETSVRGEACDVVTAVDALDLDADRNIRHHYILVAVRCRWISGTPVAGDDALEAAWFDLDTLESADLAMSFGVADVARQAAKRVCRKP
ncbi:NUDIX hydrolase [Methylocella sp. CPCC 101449]|jgi:ADP-ribose pyrophosphatase YjhB (NUDIX family)|uniref:NUDIX hydrolase n=1 Tax=Methylocella sp. CPCC 101449 TaxID=2987531 RepID=UPI00288D7056|nr:NUDIX hydrolase [Methylocella sp. CPCC 101449]MDT2019709.1 NUDIX hydrolase [Methylocella sp. CPCC 101449]HEV2575384.1 NUDIX hydrolase [Beijerinckiaceae bacterium]